MSILKNLQSSGKQNNNQQAHLDTDTGLASFPEDIRKTIQSDIYDNGLYHLGIEQGRLLMNHETQIKAIEGKYLGFIQTFQEANRKKIEKAKFESTLIEKELNQIDSALNEFNENSELNVLKNKIIQVEQKLEDYDSNIYEDLFLKEQYKIFKEEITTGKKYINGLFEEYEDLRAIVRGEINNLKALIEKNNRGGQDKNLKSQLDRDYSVILDILAKIDEKANNLLDPKTKKISSSYKNLSHFIDQISPKVYRRSQILIYYLICLIIFTGEFYLVYNFTTDVLMPGAKQNNFAGYFNNPITLTVIGFCIAFPLAIGMVFKLLLKDIKPRDERAKYLRNKILKPLCFFTIIGLIAIGIPNSIEIVQENNEVELEKIFGIFSPDMIKLYSIMIFSPILTLVLSIVGAILLMFTVEMHKEYANTKKRSLILSRNYRKSLNEDKKKYEEKLNELLEKQKQKHRELAETKSIYTTPSDSEFILSRVNTYKETAINCFMSGYNKGVNEICRDWEELEIILYKKRKALLQVK